MIMFCSFEQMPIIIEYAKKHGFKNHIPLFFIKNYSAQVLKANMRVVGATEHALILYRDKLPKFNNNKKMIFNWMEWKRDNAKEYPKVHPTQKPVALYQNLLQRSVRPGDEVLDSFGGTCPIFEAADTYQCKAVALEANPEYFAMGFRRLQALQQSEQLALF